ncbi:glyoxylate reductase/hydroxypyruvate reductase [Elysia marginata]|uniref:Glyoxylate reductase/hydroxypyruvate reductase n=1 Tax=Elysia marginata TaxID=1093978 RepID=A0AAV4H2F8_9GAST|nr:glyoxylate reductase/hydroxypyruvate reductase [Elysia marginata]
MSLSTQLPKLFVIRPIPPTVMARLRRRCQVTVHESDQAPTRQEYLDAVRGVDAFFILPFVKVDKELLDAAGPQLKVIGTFSVGVEHIDIDLCKERGVKVANTPGVVTTATAEHAMSLILAAACRLREGIQGVNDGLWGNKWESGLWLAGAEIAGSVIGMVGLGRIGLAIAKRLAAFEVSKILYTARNPRPESADPIGAEYVTFNDLLEQSDFVVIACSANDSNKGLFNAEAFKRMKKTSILVNIARGTIVDQDALYEALKTGEIGAAGLDVTTPEPLPPSDPLLGLPNCIVTPHIASCTVTTHTAMCDLVADNIFAALEGKPLKTPLY